jgi:hypothetical protein
MTPMRANSDNEVANPSAGDSRSGPVPSTATARHERGAVEGTVGAAIAAVEDDSNSPGSVALLRAEITAGKLPVPGRTRTDELLAELQEISGQVNRMMAQVDRAIDRLGEHAGEPLRR